MRTMVFVQVIIISICGLTMGACAAPRGNAANLPNPAAVFCQEQGYMYEIRTDAEGNNDGVCVFSENESCDGWEFYYGICVPSDNEADPIATEPAPPEPTEAVLPEKVTYRDDEYRFEVAYPAHWEFEVSSIGQESDLHPFSKLLRFSMENWVLSLHVKFNRDTTVIGGGFGAGDMVQEGIVSLLGKSVPVNKLVYEGKTKLVWYGAQMDDIEIFAKLEDTSHQDYGQIVIDSAIQAEAEKILESLTRIGEPLTLSWAIWV
jgi:putative hemolysin